MENPNDQVTYQIFTNLPFPKNDLKLNLGELRTKPRKVNNRFVRNIARKAFINLSPLNATLFQVQAAPESELKGSSQSSLKAAPKKSTIPTVSSN